MAIYAPLNEGKQAEEYKARKRQEIINAKKEKDDKWDRRYSVGAQLMGDNYAKDKRDFETVMAQKKKARDIVNKEDRNRDVEFDLAKNNSEKIKALSKSSRLMSGRDEAEDAAERHIRRHPKQYRETSIFEAVRFI